MDLQHLTGPPVDRPVDRAGAVTITGAEFAVIREGIGYTRAEMAALLGTSSQTIENWEKKGSKRGAGHAVPADVGTEMEELEGEWLDLVNALAAHLLDAPESVLQIPRKGDGTRPAGWWRTVAHQVTLQVPGLTIVYAEE